MSAEERGEAREADKRRRALDRAVEASYNLAEAAWGQRRRDPLEPHALGFLFTSPKSVTTQRTIG